MTDEAIIEAMARAMFKDDQINRLDIAKAALAVARPIIEAQERERCAKIAEAANTQKYFCPSQEFGMGYEDALTDIADAIRGIVE